MSRFKPLVSWKKTGYSTSTIVSLRSSFEVADPGRRIRIFLFFKKKKRVIIYPDTSTFDRFIRNLSTHSRCSNDLKFFFCHGREGKN